VHCSIVKGQTLFAALLHWLIYTKGENDMAQYAETSGQPNNSEAVVPHVASPAPLGLGMIAFTTAILGCFFAGFIIPYEASGMRAAIAATFLIGGVILVLAGMWEFRKSYLMTATTFTSYGGFLSILGLIFLPNTGIMASLGTGVHLFLGLFFLCWTIFAAVLVLGAMRTSTSMVATLGFLFLAFLLLTIGELAGGSVVLTVIGGWLAIVCAIIAWFASAASILGSATRNEVFRMPLGSRLAVIE
jgi:uncharacterized protein